MDMITECENSLKEVFSYYDDIALYNTEKVLKAFQEGKVANRHFFGSTGYTSYYLWFSCTKYCFIWLIAS